MDNFVKTVKAIFGDDIKYFAWWSARELSHQIYTNKFYELCQKIINYAINNGDKMRILTARNYIKKRDPVTRRWIKNVLKIQKLPKLFKMRYQQLNFISEDLDIFIEICPCSHMQISVRKMLNGRREIFPSYVTTVHQKIFFRSLLHGTADITKHINDIQLTYLLLNGFCDRGEI